LQKRVSSIEELKKLAIITADKDGADFFILLNGGLRSSKHISYNARAGRFWIANWIDGSTQWLTENQLKDKGLTLIGEAIEKGALFFED
jgi:hypothetical protein